MLATINQPMNPAADALNLAQAFLSGRCPQTLQAYRRDLEDFQAFTEAPTTEGGVTLLISRGPGRANALALAYRVHLQKRNLAPATVNRRLAALRSVVKLGRTLGLVTCTLEVEGLKTRSYRDTRGPGLQGVRQMLEHLEASSNAKSIRDTAIIRALYGMGLRRGELISLDLCDLDLADGRMAIIGKGRLEKESLSIPPRTLESLRAWVAVRGEEEGPLFTSLDNKSHGHRLVGSSVYRLVAKLGRAVGLTTRPHGLRHSAITDALNLTNGNTRSVQRFSRHRRLETLSAYDDNRADLGGQVAILVDLGA